MQIFPEQLLGQVCEKKGEFFQTAFDSKYQQKIRDISYSGVEFVCDIQVLDKYGDIYGRERIAELLGMDLASLDVSAMTHEKKHEPDTSMLSW